MARKGTESDPTLIPYIIIFNSAGAYYGTPSRRFTKFSKDADFELVPDNETSWHQAGHWHGPRA